MNIESALASVTAEQLIAASGVSKSVVGRALKSGRLPSKGPNREKLSSGLERILATGTGGGAYKKSVDAALVVEKLYRAKQDNALRTGALLPRDKIIDAHRRAAAEFRRGAESLRRDLAATCDPATLARLDAGLEALRLALAAALEVG